MMQLQKKVGKIKRGKGGVSQDLVCFVQFYCNMSSFVDRNSFPKIGVHLDYIDRFISDHGGVTKFQCPCEEDPQKLRSLTTSEVVERFIKPQTERNKVSYCEYLSYGCFIGKPNVFISHAWGDSFLELKERLCSLNLPEYRPEGIRGDLIIWLDIFSHNQHTTTKKPHDWVTTFYEAVKNIGCTVFMLTPNAVTRAWCIWELFCTIETRSHFQIAMSQTLSEKTRSYLFGATVKIESAKSECRDQEDEKLLRLAIDSKGFEKIDSLVSEKMNEEVQRLRGLVQENIKELLPIVPRENIVGIAVDFSGSMKIPFESLRGEAEGKLTKSRNLLSRIETIINALLERLRDTDMQGKQIRFFVCAFGLEDEVLNVDIINMIRFMISAFKKSRYFLLKRYNGKDVAEACWEDIIRFFERNGAPYIRDYVNKQSCSPVGLVMGAVGAVGIMGCRAVAQQVAIQVDTQSKRSAKSIVDKPIKDGDDYYLQPQLLPKYKDFVRPLDMSSLITHEELQSLLNDWNDLKINEQHSFLGEFNLFNTNFYGPSTPLYQTYFKAVEMFRGFESEEFGKVLLTISDGESNKETPHDEDRGKIAIKELKQMNVQLVNCFLSTRSLTGKQLLSQRPKEWSEGPAFLFDNASEVKKDHPALLKLQAKGWDLSKFEEKYRLFFHANTSEIIDTFLEVALDLTK